MNGDLSNGRGESVVCECLLLFCICFTCVGMNEDLSNGREEGVVGECSPRLFACVLVCHRQLICTLHYPT